MWPALNSVTSYAVPPASTTNGSRVGVALLDLAESRDVLLREGAERAVAVELQGVARQHSRDRCGRRRPVDCGASVPF